MTSSDWRILIIDNDLYIRSQIQRMLREDGERHFEFSEVCEGALGLQMLEATRAEPFDCVVLGLNLPDMDAHEFLQLLFNDAAPIPSAIVVVTGDDRTVGRSLLQMGAQDFIGKLLLSPERLRHTIENAIERFKLSNESTKSQDAVRESDEKFRGLLESAPDAIVIVDNSGVIVIVNALTKRLFGYSRAELIGQYVEMLMPSRYAESHELQSLNYTDAPRTRTMEGGRELLGLHKDGCEFPIEVSLSPLKTKQGVLLSIAIRDITDRRHVEEMLRKADGQLRFIMDSMPQKISTRKPNGDVDYVNPQWMAFTGLAFEQLQDWRWLEILHSEDRPAHHRLWKESIENGALFECESRFRRHDGVYRWHISRALPMRDVTGQIVMWVGSNTDVHDIKHVEEALQVSEVRYRRLFEAAKDGILILDFGTGKIVDANPFMSDLLGYSYSDFAGKELWEIGLFSDKVANEEAVRKLQVEGYLRYEHLPLESNDGRRVEVEVVANAYREGLQQVIQCNIRDITDRSRLERLLQVQAEELSNLHRRKDEFLAMLSHELRSPLAPIANAVQVLGLQSESPLQRRARGIIERQLGQLQHLVDDLLEVSRITTGRVQLRLERVVVSSIVEHALETVRPIIAQRRQEISLTLSAEPMWLNADAARLEQVMANLLTNAAKYTPEGGHIWVTVRNEDNECVLHVRDTGVGISAELLPRIFDLFTQAERSLDRSQGGLGIGLALVQRLTELHGGRVEVTSTLGLGSEFVVRLPIGASDALTTPKTIQGIKTVERSLRVLVVDDNLDAAQTLELLLQSLGHNTCKAYDGPTALETAMLYLPDLVLLDIGLPYMDGYEVARQLRLQPLLKEAVLVAFTGYGQESDRIESQRAGFDHHLVKPARFDLLKKILTSTAEKLSQRDAAEAPI